MGLHICTVFREICNCSKINFPVRPSLKQMFQFRSLDARNFRFKRSLHLQNAMNASRHTFQFSSLIRSPNLRIFLRLVKSPSHILFVVSNLAILVHLQFVSTHRTAQAACKADQENLARLHAQIRELEDLEEEERQIRNDIESLKLQEDKKRYIKTIPGHEEKHTPFSGRQLQRHANRKLASEFEMRRATISKNFLWGKGLHSLFSFEPQPRWGFEKKDHVYTETVECTHIHSPIQRNDFQGLCRLLLKEAVHEANLRNGQASFEAIAGDSLVSSLKSLMHEALSGHCLTYEKSDTTKYIASSQVLSINQVLVPLADVLEELKEAFVSYRHRHSKGELLLDLCRLLILSNTQSHFDQVLFTLYHNFGQLKLHKYQALLLKTFPSRNLTRISQKALLEMTQQQVNQSEPENGGGDRIFQTKHRLTITHDPMKHHPQSHIGLLQANLLKHISEGLYFEVECLIREILKFVNERDSASAKSNPVQSEEKYLHLKLLLDKLSREGILEAFESQPGLGSKFQWLWQHLAKDRMSSTERNGRSNCQTFLTGNKAPKERLSKDGTKDSVLLFLPKLHGMAVRV